MLRNADKADIFLAKFELRLKLKYLGDDWPQDRDADKKLPHYIVTVRRLNGPRFSFDFWPSSEASERSENQEPSTYDILASLGESSQLSPDPDEVYEEFGEMKPSQAVGMARFAKRVRKFFSNREMIELRRMGLEAASSARAGPRARRLSPERESMKQVA